MLGQKWMIIGVLMLEHTYAAIDTKASRIIGRKASYARIIECYSLAKWV